jgi:hypothetical protein
MPSGLVLYKIRSTFEIFAFLAFLLLTFPAFIVEDKIAFRTLSFFLFYDILFALPASIVVFFAQCALLTDEVRLALDV